MDLERLLGHLERAIPPSRCLVTIGIRMFLVREPVDGHINCMYIAHAHSRATGQIRR